MSKYTSLLKKATIFQALAQTYGEFTGVIDKVMMSIVRQVKDYGQVQWQISSITEHPERGLVVVQMTIYSQIDFLSLNVNPNEEIKQALETVTPGLNFHVSINYSKNM